MRGKRVFKEKNVFGRKIFTFFNRILNTIQNNHIAAISLKLNFIPIKKCKIKSKKQWHYLLAYEIGFNVFEINKYT